MTGKQMYVDLNLNFNQLLQALFENVPALPTQNDSSQSGRVVYLTTDEHAYKSNGTEWVKILEGDDSKVTLEKDSTGLIYTLKQAGVEIGKINIPKDMVVRSGSIVKGTFAESGAFTESSSGKDTALKLVIANSSQAVYINVRDLAVVYSGGTTADISVTVNGGVIEATLSQSVKNQLSQIADKVDKVTGKGLSTNDFTDAHKAKLDGLKNSIRFISDSLVGNSGNITNDVNGLSKDGVATILQCYKGSAEIIIQLEWIEGEGVISWASNTKFESGDGVRIHALQAGL